MSAPGYPKVSSISSSWDISPVTNTVFQRKWPRTPDLLVYQIVFVFPGDEVGVANLLPRLPIIIPVTNTVFRLKNSSRQREVPTLRSSLRVWVYSNSQDPCPPG